MSFTEYKMEISISLRRRVNEYSTQTVVEVSSAEALPIDGTKLDEQVARMFDTQIDDMRGRALSVLRARSEFEARLLELEAPETIDS
jgi:hypothetical protein